MDTLNIPTGLAIVIEPNTLGEAGSLRIECRTVLEAGQLAGFGEVAYWHTDGSNDIMQGEIGTLTQAIQALVDFTAR